MKEKIILVYPHKRGGTTKQQTKTSKDKINL